MSFRIASSCAPAGRSGACTLRRAPGRRTSMSRTAPLAAGADDAVLSGSLVYTATGQGRLSRGASGVPSQSDALHLSPRSPGAGTTTPPAWGEDDAQEAVQVAEERILVLGRLALVVQANRDLQYILALLPV